MNLCRRSRVHGRQPLRIKFHTQLRSYNDILVVVAMVSDRTGPTTRLEGPQRVCVCYRGYFPVSVAEKNSAVRQ
jgi:hypothetical protein